MLCTYSQEYLVFSHSTRTSNTRTKHFSLTTLGLPIMPTTIELLFSQNRNQILFLTQNKS